jgi:adenylate cyclase class IV
MSELETLPSHSDTKLQELASDLDNFLGSQLEFETGVGKFEKQAKYILDNPAELYHKLSLLEGAELVERVYQTDYYVIPQGIKPTFQSEYLRLREDNYQELPGTNIPQNEMVAYLTYKTTGEALSEDVGTRTSKTINLDFDQAISVLDYLTKRGVSFRKVAKERTVFHYNGTTISIDQGVQFTDESEASNLLGSGSFLEIMQEDEHSSIDIDEFARELGIVEPKITEPYANVEFFISHYQDRLNNAAKATPEIPEVNDFDFVDFDSINDTLITHVDWGRVLKSISSGQANAISNDVEKQAELISALKAKLGILITQIRENPDKSLAVTLTNSGQRGGQLSGSIKALRDIDGFSNYPRPKSLLEDYATFEIRGLAHYQINGDGVRVMLTVGRTKNNTVVFFPHKIYMSKSDQDDRGNGQKSNSPAGWINRHQKRLKITT